jgi:hypothetical protein
MSSYKNEINDNLDKEVELKSFNKINYQDSTISFSKLRKKYNYLSLVYLDEECSICYHKFIEWQEKMDTVAQGDSYAIIYVLRGSNKSDFISKVKLIGKDHSDYYMVYDPTYDFISDNKNIPLNIINKSLLIDSNNRIRLIGAPFLTSDMMKLFYKILGNS